MVPTESQFESLFALLVYNNPFLTFKISFEAKPILTRKMLVTDGGGRWLRVYNFSGDFSKTI